MSHFVGRMGLRRLSVSPYALDRRRFVAASSIQKLIKTQYVVPLQWWAEKVTILHPAVFQTAAQTS